MLSLWKNHPFLPCTLAAILALPISAQDQVVKKSSSGICHDTNSQYYTRTKNYTSFNSLLECLNSGGRLPKNISETSVQQLIETEMKTAESEGRSFSSLYDRSDWPHWSDYDGDCQNTRAELLIQQSQLPVLFTNSKKCTVKSGRWIDPFTNKSFIRASDLDIDHIVPLAWAHGHGGQHWSTKDKESFANDINNLLIVDDGLNSQKGAKGPDQWLPPHRSFHCQYIKMFDRIVNEYDLRYTSSEERIIADLLENCGVQ